MMIRTLLAILLAVPLPAQSAPAAPGGLRLPWVFADHMVLQRGRPIVIWGQAEPGSEVRVALAGDNVVAQAQMSGEWRAELPARVASAKGRELVVSAGSHELRLQDVLVGEVWLCAGQSNMDFPLSRSDGGQEAMDELASSPILRLCNRTGFPAGGARRLSPEELGNISPETYYSGSWQVASAESAGAFSAVGFAFGQRLGADLAVPVGLIDVSVGRSTTEGWIRPGRLEQDPAFAPLLEDYLGTHLSHPFIRERVATHLSDWVDAGRQAPRPRHFFEPGFLFQSALGNLAPFRLRGVLWYQGESNAHLPRLADRLFRAMVEEWRGLWQEPDLPIYFVQLPAMGRSTWPEFREVQASWLELPHTGMAVAVDVGHPTNVHPTDKRPVGERLARVALANTYHKDIAAQGPVPASTAGLGHQLEIRFQQTGGLAWAPGGSQLGFEVCGDDRRFHPAQAELEGGSVLLSSPEVPTPVDARYAWAPVPAWGLTDGTGLPAAPFRTHR